MSIKRFFKRLYYNLKRAALTSRNGQHLIYIKRTSPLQPGEFTLTLPLQCFSLFSLFYAVLILTLTPVTAALTKLLGDRD